MTKVVTLEPLFHRDKHLIAFRFKYDEEIKSIIKGLRDRDYTKTHHCWYVPSGPKYLDEILKAFEGRVTIDASAIQKSLPARPQPVNAFDRDRQLALRMMEQQIHLKGYAKSTELTYLDQFKLFMQFFPEIHPLDLGEAEIQIYLLHLVEQRHLSRSTQNQAINAIKFFFEKVMKQERKVYQIERPIKEKKLPSVLSQEHILAIFEAAGNIKHRCMLMLIYSAGLRRKELLALRTSDIDVDRGVVFIRGGKGHKDRQSVLAQSLVPFLQKYLEEYNPALWLFEGRVASPYSASSLQQVLKDAARKAGIKKRVHLHMLRHSFATHLLEAGTSTRYIQALLGHESPKTTEIYAHVTRFGLDKLRSPLDQIANSKRLRGDDDPE